MFDLSLQLHYSLLTRGYFPDSYTVSRLDIAETRHILLVISQGYYSRPIIRESS